MLTFEFPMNALMLFAIIVSSGFIGYWLRRGQIAVIHKKLLKAENEMISSHAEILEMQKEYISMELKLRGIKDPVIVMTNPNDAGNQEKMPNGALRKKLLRKDFSPSRSEGYGLIYDNLLNKEVSTGKA